jgi:hypothetical protein
MNGEGVFFSNSSGTIVPNFHLQYPHHFGRDVLHYDKLYPMFLLQGSIVSY